MTSTCTSRYHLPESAAVMLFLTTCHLEKPLVKQSSFHSCKLPKFPFGVFSKTVITHKKRVYTVGPVKAFRLTATAVSSQITLAQQDLLDYVAPLELGRKALNNSAIKAVVNEKIALLELMNPTPVPVDSPQLGGKWRLVYTDSENILGVSRPRLFQPVGAIYQSIFLDTMQVENAETMQPFGISLENKVWATFTKSPPRKVFVQFRRFQFGPFRFPAPDSARGFLETTFLDNRMRISRGNRKHVFVLVKE